MSAVEYIISSWRLQTVTILSENRCSTQHAGIQYSYIQKGSTTLFAGWTVAPGSQLADSDSQDGLQNLNHKQTGFTTSSCTRN